MPNIASSLNFIITSNHTKPQAFRGLQFCVLSWSTFLPTVTFTQNADGFSSMLIDIHQRSQNLCHLYSCMGLKWGSLGFFRNQNNRGHLHLPRSQREDKRAKCCTAREDRGRNCFICVFACVIGKDPNLRLVADDAITQAGIGGLGISGTYLYYNKVTEQVNSGTGTMHLSVSEFINIHYEIMTMKMALKI